MADDDELMRELLTADDADAVPNLLQVFTILSNYELIQGRGGAVVTAVCGRAHRAGVTREWPGMLALGVETSAGPFMADKLLLQLLEHEELHHADGVDLSVRDGA